MAVDFGFSGIFVSEKNHSSYGDTHNYIRDFTVLGSDEQNVDV